MYTFSIDNSNLYLEADGNVFIHSINEFPLLANATQEQRENFTLSPFGIHWPELDEDLSYEGLIKARTA
ncbi:MAG: hypothetical protein RIS29_442 [Bacteroidota bacterium]|jgi:hypothetical protein